MWLWLLVLTLVHFFELQHLKKQLFEETWASDSCNVKDYVQEKLGVEKCSPWGQSHILSMFTNFNWANHDDSRASTL